MKLVINGRFLTQAPSGVQNYAIGILKALEKAEIPFELVKPANCLINFNTNEKIIGHGSGFFWEQFFLPRYIKRQKNVLLLNLCNSAPLTLKNQIVTIHDLAFEEDHKQWFTTSFRMWYKFLIPRICANSRMIYTVSEFSKKQIVARYTIPENKIQIIPNGLPEIIFDNSALPIKGKYLLITGANNPRKNVDWVIKNINILKENGLKLLILGDSAPIYKQVKIPEDDSILFLKNSSSSLYYNLLKNSEALLFPSYYEGFGIPILESLCMGTPVIASNLEVFKESFGDLPIYFKLNDAADFNQAIKTLANKQISDFDIEKLKNKFNFDNSVALILKSLAAFDK
jgi:glycosyltransferase involved in cell wall biosynthesis